MMRVRLMGKVAASALGLGVGALLAAAPATAQVLPGGEYLTLSPTTVAPGGTVSVTMGCDADILDAGVTSAITGTTILEPDAVGPASYNYSGSVRVPAGAQPGTYEFSGGCGSPAFLVVGPGGQGPAGGTGLESDSDGGLVAAGAGTLAVAAAGGLWLLRRRGSRAPRA